jgi:accessory gene regulator protein AgrB
LYGHQSLWLIAQPVKLTAQRSHSPKMKQSKLNSLKEAVTNIAIGYIVGMITQLILYPIYGIHIAFTTNLALSFWFTIVAIARSYFVRRYYNYQLHKNNTISQQITA